jgi:hydroxymethylglutaryl-CoA lyase
VTAVLPTEAVLREVGPRDGLQNEAPVEPAARAALIEALLAAGVTRIEAVSFVSPTAVPAMARPAEVLGAVAWPDGVTVSALVPNRRGAELALQHPVVAELTVTIAASPAYNQRNVGMTIDQSLEAVAEICALAGPAGVPVDAVISCAFGSPYEGDMDPGAVADLADRLLDRGATAITLADTTGMATPRVLADVLAETGTAVGLHVHETRGTGLLNCYAALEAGVRRFDSSVGGLGGSPFADGAAGNVATEDLVALLDDLGVASGIDLGALLAASRLLEELIGRPVPSRVAHAGPRLGPAPPADGAGTG